MHQNHLLTHHLASPDTFNPLRHTQTQCLRFCTTLNSLLTDFLLHSVFNTNNECSYIVLH